MNNSRLSALLARLKVHLVMRVMMVFLGGEEESVSIGCKWNL
jgi:hypothetical protein